ncbi:MAG: hypothetical protein RLY30_496 [Pseudomonadota bacterium]|jgi:beta-glucanase (GH16 family)
MNDKYPGLIMSLMAASAVTLLGTSPAWGGGFEPPSQYRLVWADEFDQAGLPNPSNWVHDTHRNKEGWYNNEKQYYSRNRPENAVVRDGKLLIQARRETLRGAEDWGGQPYTSARLITRGRAEWTYGFFEIRAKLPCGKGTWPAIWALGSGDRWPDDGELDIMEHVGSNPEVVSSAVHVAMGHAGQAFSGSMRLSDACETFHRYQMHWTPDGVVFGVDGHSFLRYPKTDVGRRGWPFDKPQYLLLNVAIGGDLGGPVDDSIFPVTMEVDYVRVFQKPAIANSK